MFDHINNKLNKFNGHSFHRSAKHYWIFLICVSFIKTFLVDERLNQKGFEMKALPNKYLINREFRNIPKYFIPSSEIKSTSIISNCIKFK